MKFDKNNIIQIMIIIVSIILIKEIISPTKISDLRSYTYDIIENNTN